MREPHTRAYTHTHVMCVNAVCCVVISYSATRGSELVQRRIAAPNVLHSTISSPYRRRCGSGFAATGCVCVTLCNARRRRILSYKANTDRPTDRQTDISICAAHRRRLRRRRCRCGWSDSGRCIIVRMCVQCERNRAYMKPTAAHNSRRDG